MKLTARNDRVGIEAETAEESMTTWDARISRISFFLPPFATPRPGVRSFAVNTLLPDAIINGHGSYQTEYLDWQRA